MQVSSCHPLTSNRVMLSVTSTGGHLDGVTFVLDDGRAVRPMHAAPWRGEDLGADTPPMLRQLTGDFFCAPFGPGDLTGHESPVHGHTANGTWTLTGQTDTSLDLMLDTAVMGAKVTKSVSVRPNERIVYQRHVLSGGDGQLPLGHHAMLSARSPLTLAFGPWVWAGTPPDPTETGPDGRCLLAEGQTFTDLRQAPLAAGGHADLTRYPFAERHDDIWMVVADATHDFGWTAATCADEGWVWFSLKDQKLLPQTVVWMSNGGRDYPPWNGRHVQAIGLEDVCAQFHLGHQASLEAHRTGDAPAATVATLSPDDPLMISYLFGLAPVPAGFGQVATIKAAPGGVVITDQSGTDVFAACDTAFLKPRK